MRALLLALLVLSTAPAAAAADDCDALAARIVDATPMRFERRANQYIHFKGPAPLDTLSVHCGETGYRPSIGVFSNETALPPPAFFDAVAAVSVLALGLPREKVRADALLCQRRALKDADGDASFDRPGYQVNCSLGQPSRDPKKDSQGFIGVQIFKTP